MLKSENLVGDEALKIPTVGEFLAGKNVFITGATGFLGTVLIERLLSATPKIGKIFILIRDKNGKTAQERVDRLMKKIVSKILRK